MCRSSTISDMSRLELASDAHDPVYYAPYLTVNRTKIRTSRKPEVEPEVQMNEIWILR